jgi:hypothetical protein
MRFKFIAIVVILQKKITELFFQITTLFLKILNVNNFTIIKKNLYKFQKKN